MIGFGVPSRFGWMRFRGGSYVGLPPSEATKYSCPDVIQVREVPRNQPFSNTDFDPTTMTEQYGYGDISSKDDQSFDYVYEQNVSIPLKDSGTVVRANIYRPKDKDANFPVLVTYGPYGKDIPYKE
jgi:predicted acyl esterase